ncbi:MAG: 2-succinyl-5-enolpyruvyl-6-hydroxy-3-cyclohexene-1-carboxylic-acid synthase [bacterium]|nr:2-succinyl-5-enolpyruvyl-6-hydroxy-3-cyclohexene-1-carboxylic-acid synthase [bacterium]
MNIYQTNINTIIATLFSKGLRRVVICPGSRNAPLVMAFARFGKIECISIADERSAAFVALGMSKQLGEPVAVVCTSGSAVVNLYPAVVEAYYMQIPLILITADRPAEMLDRWDGQTIHQEAIFSPHILVSLQTPEGIDEDQIDLISHLSSQLFDASNGLLKGPVHLNVPLMEPLYSAVKEKFKYPNISIISNRIDSIDDWEIAIDKAHFFTNYPKVMVLHGTSGVETDNTELSILSANAFVVSISDVVSNKHSYQTIPNWEGVFLNANGELQKDLVPDLLITTGKMVLNKTIKTLFRNNPPKRHWHIAENGYCADTFFTEPEVLSLAPSKFFNQFNPFLPTEKSEYQQLFKKLGDQQKELSDITLSQNYNEFNAVKIALENLPDNIVLHLSNSMSIRYVAYLNSYLKTDWEIYSNRGVSGIDGCTSTALGAAMTDPRMHVLITGDIAFFYDINALWQTQLPNNFKIIILNNFGGGIFKNIDGPAGMAELNPFIATPHKMDAELLAQHFKLNYFKVVKLAELEPSIKAWLSADKASILEIQTDSTTNSDIFNQYKQQIL